MTYTADIKRELHQWLDRLDRQIESLREALARRHEDAQRHREDAELLARLAHERRDVVMVIERWNGPVART
jgi:hypothetical protein